MNGFEVGQGGPKPLTKIQRVLATVGDSTTVNEIAQDTGFGQHYIRNALRMLRAYGQVVRTDEGLPRCETAHFSITEAGRAAVAAAGPVESESAMPPVSMVAHALAQRHQLATVWMGQ